MKYILLIAGLVGAVLVSLSVGTENVSLRSALSDPDSLSRLILLEIRLPRILLGGLVGLALASAGAAFQALLRNPLADPFILGVSGGAALGSVLAVSLKLAYGFVPLVAFLAALGSMFLIYGLANVRGRLNPHTLLLVGVLFNTTTFSLILFFNSIVSMEDLHRIWFLMVGSLEAVELHRLFWVALFVLTGFFILCLDASALNLIPLGEESARSLGVDVEGVRRRVFFAASLMVGSVVSVSGLVGFVGLAVPHMVRLALGSDHRRVLPASALVGAAFLILADALSRTAFSREGLQTQLPVGVVTALVGAPIFFYLLKKKGM